MKQKLFRFAALSTIYIRTERAIAQWAPGRRRGPRTAMRQPNKPSPTRINKIDLFIYGARRGGPGGATATQVESPSSQNMYGRDDGGGVGGDDDGRTWAHLE